MLRIVQIALFLVLFGLIRPAGTELIAEGNSFPDLVLELPGKAAADYLGIPDSERTPLSGIQSQGVIINVYSLYCPPCNREAKRLNNLYSILLERGIPLKLIGLAAGNAEAEVEAYRIKHDVPFPLFKDPDYAMHDATGKLPVPYFYVVSLQGKSPTVVLSFVGEVTDEEAFLARALDALGLKSSATGAGAPK
jgi:peroxiredoxin